MGAIGSSVRVLFRRPSMLLLFGIITLVFCILEYYALTIFSNLFGVMDGGNLLEIPVSFLHVVLNNFANLYGVTYFILFVITGSLLAGFFMSGYAHTVNNCIERKKKCKGEFFLGVRKNFGKMFRISFMVILLGTVFTVFMLVATVPAIVVTSAAVKGRIALFFIAILFDVLTLMVLFFGLMFFRMYMFFWFPAAAGQGKRAFLMGKRAADRNYWGIVKKFIFFDIVFIGMQMFMMFSGYYSASEGGAASVARIPLFIGNWVFKTLFFAVFIIYIFITYWEYGKIKK